jgi:hypothetical protein
MTNHVHLLATPVSEPAISEMMQYLGRHYVRYFNFRYGRTGTLFERRFKSRLVQTDGYLLACQRYIELNLVRARVPALFLPNPALFDNLRATVLKSVFGLGDVWHHNLRLTPVVSIPTKTSSFV